MKKVEKHSLMALLTTLIADHLLEISKLSAKLQDDFCYAFERGYAFELFMEKLIVKDLQAFLTFLNNEPERAEEWLRFNIESKTKELLKGGYIGRSSGVGHNIGHTLRKEVEVKMIEIYSFYLDRITNDNLPIK